MDPTIKVIDSKEGFANLEKEWNSLYSENHEATIFLSWDWMYTWWDVYSKSISSKLFILCVYDDNELIGIAPFYILNSFPKSLIQGRTLIFLGSGERSKDKIVSQYHDFLVKPEKQTEVTKSIATFLQANTDKWDFADFEFLLGSSMVFNCFNDNTTDIHIKKCQYGNRFYIADFNTFDDFLHKMGNRWSKMFTKKNRKLHNQGDVKIESPNDIESVKLAFQQLTKMHEERWQGRVDFNIFKSELFNEFHTKILEKLVPQNKAFIKTLTIDDQALASYYCFTDKSQVHYYQSGFYSENANKYSPLFLLVCKEIGSAIKANLLFDFMFDEDSSSYKREQYAAQSEPMYRLKWSHKQYRMSLFNCAKKIQLKYLKLQKKIKNN